MPAFTLHCINKDCLCESEDEFDGIEEARIAAERHYCPTCGLDVEALESFQRVLTLIGN